MAAMRFNPLIREFYQRLIGRGKLGMVALIAAMRKLLTIAVGILNNKTAFDAHWAERRKALTKWVDREHGISSVILFKKRGRVGFLFNYFYIIIKLEPKWWNLVDTHV